MDERRFAVRVTRRKCSRRILESAQKLNVGLIRKVPVQNRMPEFG